jgi:TonB family protein
LKPALFAAVALFLAAASAAAQTPAQTPAPEAPPPGDGAALSVRVQWAQRPDTADVEKLRPSGFRDAAQVVLRCRLTEQGKPADGRLHVCAVQSEAPQGHGLAAAALSLTDRFRMDSKSYASMPDDALVLVPVRWRSLAPPVPSRGAAFGGSVTGMEVITQPKFLASPTRAALKAVQPAGKSGRVLVECTVAADTNVKDCRLMEESPLGAGLGEAAMKLTNLFRVSPMLDKDGKPEEAVVRLAFNFDAN